MLPTTFRPDAILECLLDNEVRFIVIGGLAAFAQGAGWPTQDADIVVDCAEGNLRRLLIALSELEAEYDTLHRPPIRPNWRLLSGSTGPQLFRTKYGASMFSRSRAARRMGASQKTPWWPSCTARSSDAQVSMRCFA